MVAGQDENIYGPTDAVSGRNRGGEKIQTEHAWKTENETKNERES